DRLHDALELDEATVARRLDDAPLVLGNLRIDQLAAMGAQPRQRAGLVLAHQTAVAGDIGGENGRQPALHSLTLHQVVDPEGALATEAVGKLGVSTCA